MKLLRDLIALNSALIILVSAGCVSNRAITPANTDKLQIQSPEGIGWKDTDVNLLPLFEDPKLAENFIERLANPMADDGQKDFAFRLALFYHEKYKDNRGIALVLSYAAFLKADTLSEDGEIIKTAEAGKKAAEAAGALKDEPLPSYYYALNLGLYVRARGLFAVNRLPDIVKALKAAGKKPEIDMGGPLRVLGMLYLQAPAWPQGIGDIDASVEILAEAAKQYPYQPQNRLYYAQALLENGQKEQAVEELIVAKRMAVPQLWGAFYANRWQKEIEALEKKISE